MTSISEYWSKQRHCTIPMSSVKTVCTSRIYIYDEYSRISSWLALNNGFIHPSCVVLPTDKHQSRDQHHDSKRLWSSHATSQPRPILLNQGRWWILNLTSLSNIESRNSKVSLICWMKHIRSFQYHGYRGLMPFTLRGKGQLGSHCSEGIVHMPHSHFEWQSSS